MKKVFKSEEEAREAVCFDCGCEVKKGAVLVYEDNGEELFAAKCDQCFSQNEGISDYKKCEVYSRIVGYLRPVNQWNDGKRQEYSERKEYKVSQDK